MSEFSVAQAARQILARVEKNRQDSESWKNDENAFEQRFKIPYRDFVELVAAFDEHRRAHYELIRQTNERAAILWAIDEGRALDLLE